MDHAVEKHFHKAREAAVRLYNPSAGGSIERDIGLDHHVQRTMPMFLTLRDADGNAVATAMLPPGGRYDASFRIIIVGPGNANPYREHWEAIRKLGEHFGLTLEPERCYPYLGMRP